MDRYRHRTHPRIAGTYWDCYKVMPNCSQDTELILGFDDRVEGQSAPDWLTNCEEQYLLRLDVERVLSTDWMVWPSALSEKVVPEQPSPVGWADLSELRKYCSKWWRRRSRPLNLISVTLHLPSCEDEEEVGRWRSLLISDLNPSEVNTSWTLLGYDVSDEYLLSGLSNCGYERDEDIETARKTWSPHLNCNHLFDDPEKAMAFQKFSDQRVEEHSPFFTFGIWLIERMSK